MGIASGVVGIVEEFAEVAARRGAERGVRSCRFRIFSEPKQNLSLPVIRLGMQLRIDVVCPGAFEELEGLFRLFVLVQFHGSVEGEDLCGSKHGFVRVDDVVQGSQRPLVIAACHVDLQQKPERFISSR